MLAVPAYIRRILQELDRVLAVPAYIRKILQELDRVLAELWGIFRKPTCFT